MYQNEIYISPNNILEEYMRINLNLLSSQDEWNVAIDIFENRIRGRYLNAIEVLLDKTREFPTNYIDYSFSSMAIMCLVIETMHQFYFGINETDRYGHRDAFIGFLTQSQSFRNYFSRSLASIFYTDIRNGIIHQAQTKNNSQLTIFSNVMVERMVNGIRVDVILFYEALRDEVNIYIDRLRNLHEIDLKENFIRKMEFIILSINN